MTRSVFYHVAKDARKTRSRRRRIRTEQNSPMGFRPLDESAPSARQMYGMLPVKLVTRFFARFAFFTAKTKSFSN